MKIKRYRTLAGGLLFAAAALMPLLGAPPWARPALAVAAYLLVGYDVLLVAIKNIFRGHVFDENFLMTTATIGAFALGEVLEAAAVMIFYQVGELFQDHAVGQSRRSIAQLMDIRPDSANVLREGAVLTVDPEAVAVGETIVVKPGERVPLDALVLSGRSTLDTSALTGEPAPRPVGEGDALLSGCINQSGVLEARVTKPFGESTVSRVLDLVENASSKKSVSERFITRFARYYTPAVVVAAAALALLPPLVLGQPFREWVARALVFLVVSCPCALVISIPLSFFGGIGGASRRGVLVKGGNYLDALARAGTVVFDKTGTLTEGAFAVRRVEALDGDGAALLELAALAESMSDHPIAQSIRRALENPPDPGRVREIRELAGRGVSALVDGAAVWAGNERLMAEHDIAVPAPEDEGQTVVHVAADGVYRGYIVIADSIKPEAAATVAGLRRAGVGRVVMLTGDAEGPGQAVAEALGLDRAYTRLLPQDKVEKLEMLLEQKPAGSRLVFVGDGVNDAPALARADVGVAMGGLGRDAAIEAADVVIMDDNPAKLVTAIAVARRTVGIARQNIIFALGVKLLVLLLAALGRSQMWQAIFADVGVAVLAILNALRALRTDKL